MLQMMMGYITDKFIGGKGTEQIFGALWLFAGIQQDRCCLFLSFFFSFFHYLSLTFMFSVGRDLSLIFC